MIINLSLKNNYLYLWLLAKEYEISAKNKNSISPSLELLTEVAQFYCARSLKNKMEQVFLLPTENGSIVTAATETSTFLPWNVTAARISFNDFLEKTEGQFKKRFPKKKYPNLYVSSSLVTFGSLRTIAEEIVKSKRYYPKILISGKSITPHWALACDRATRFCLEEIAQSLPPAFFQDNHNKKPLEIITHLLDQHITKKIVVSKYLRSNIVDSSLPESQKKVLNSFLKKQEPVHISNPNEIQLISGQFEKFQNYIEPNLHNPFVLVVALKISITNTLCYKFDILNRANGERYQLSKDAITQGVPKDTLVLLMKTVRLLFPDNAYPWDEEIIVETNDIFNNIDDLHLKSRTHLFYIELPEGIKSKKLQKPRAIAHIKSEDIGDSFFSSESISQVEWKMLLGDQEVDIATLDRLVAENQTIYMNNQTMVAINPTDIKAFLKELSEIQKKELTPLELLRQSSLLDSCEFKLDTGWIKRVIEQLNGQTPIKDLDSPKNINALLRPYQIRGFSWLHFMKNLGLGACLADDMGLGKTIQTLAFLQYQKNIEKLNKPALIICPTSLMSNWKHEINTFTPELNHDVYHGTERLLDASFNKDILITSYGVVERDKEILKKGNWSVIVLDEAQNIKNPGAKQTKAIKQLTADYRIALTGTPVENSSEDLWSIIDFINPSLLGSQAWFNDYFSKILKRGDVDGDSEFIKLRGQKLKNMVSPFILRRLKSDKSIITDLPEKLEFRTYCGLKIEQVALYKATVDEMMKRIKALDGFARRNLVLITIMRLKQICNHPLQILKNDKRGLLGRSGKLERLIEITGDIQKNNEKVLIFSQFKEMGELLVQALKESFGKKPLFLNGSVTAQNRAKLVNSFQNDPEQSIFVLSLKAGGTGLNLTAANHVIHYDRWWNPAVENQATDRSYRIGQDKIVEVHKFICSGTIEDRIDQMIENKKFLSNSLVGDGEGWITELSDRDLKNLFTLDEAA